MFRLSTGTRPLDTKLREEPKNNDEQNIHNGEIKIKKRKKKINDKAQRTWSKTKLKKTERQQ